MSKRRVVFAFGILIFTASALLLPPISARGQAAPAATDFQVNQQVEAREGDAWSPATVVAREGRKLQIKYADGTLEWVTVDRLRIAGKQPATPATPGTPAADPAAKTPATGPAKPAPKEQYANGAKVEAKSGNTWTKGVIKNHDGDLYLVCYDGWEKQFFWQWVHVSMVRNPGDSKVGPKWGGGVTLGNSTIPQAKADAKKKFANIESQLADEADAAKARGETGERRDPFAPKPYDKPVLEVKLDGVPEKSVTQAPARPAAPAAASATGPAVPANLAARPITLRGEISFHATSQLLFNGASCLAVVHEGSEHDPSSLRVERVDLATGTSVGAMRWELASIPISISRSGQRVLGRATGFFHDTRNRVDLWELAGSPVAQKHLVSFEPYRGQPDRTRDVAWAALVDDDHALTCSSGNLLVMWEVRPGAVKAIWKMPVESSTTLVLGPTGRSVACMSKFGLAVLDVSNGATLGLVPTVRTLSSLSYATDGKYVIGASGATLSCWDMEKGIFVGDIGAPIGVSLQTVACGNDGFALLGGKHVMDLSSKLVVWSFQTPFQSPCFVFAGRIWSVQGEKEQHALMSDAFPRDTIRAVAKSAAAAPDAMLLKPGKKISLEVSLEGDDKQVQSATAAIKAELGRKGLFVEDNQPIKVAARTENGKTTEQVWQSQTFGRGPMQRETSTVSVTEKITRLSIEYDGKVIWENKTVSVPFHVQGKEGQSINEAVANANQFNLRFLESVRLPTYIAKPREEIGFGSTKIDASGFKDVVK